MTSKLRTIIHFSISLIIVFFTIIIFNVVFITMNDTGEIFFSKTTSEILGISFGLGLLVSFFLYTIITIILSRGSNPIRVILPIVLTTLGMGMVISLITYGFVAIDKTIFSVLVVEIIVYILTFFSSIF